ncbi:aspartate aminotransferase family protein [Methylococcus capsulatus]|uniref:aspartate aminotransferase family protein n=1 Tax=Methylococcus capsulatus TaxID=414 RepID=UPI001C532491|nr:aspartate aminotransferase family protein [Methylococcus capsulatus]QXP87304.1 aspartate aminotransferase family protein [Methylococcus capsulatus]QXP92955.1 aspartate aminotransferase family protein [Methylococcus capsulatus]UQN12304.1 aspartate aminotransferase family protein [Methylococcus capsulatus]
MMSNIMPTYARQPVTFTHGEGAWLFDTEGKRYLDAVSGVAVCSLGHAHPAVAKALCDQAGRLVHCSNLYRIGLQEDLAKQLCDLSGMDNAFFCNSGAEANEAALKIARRYGHHRGIDTPKIVVMEGSFHGRTLATLSATGNPKVQEGFAPLVGGFVRLPYGDAEAVAAVDDPDVVAVLVEPVQGEGGVRIPPDDYLARLKSLCERRGWLLMLDEVQTGMGRTGRMFGHQHTGVTPDVMALAKALGNGVPIGACLARGVAAEMLTAGKHGSTFGGNPLACAAALAVIDTLTRQSLAQRAEILGQRLLDGFRTRLSGRPGVIEIRGLGLMIGLELERPCTRLVGMALERGLLINVTAERTVRLLPPLILTDAQADDLVERLCSLVEAHLDAAG